MQTIRTLLESRGFEINLENIPADNKDCNPNCAHPVGYGPRTLLDMNIEISGWCASEREQFNNLWGLARTISEIETASMLDLARISLHPWSWHDQETTKLVIHPSGRSGKEILEKEIREKLLAHPQESQEAWEEWLGYFGWAPPRKRTERLIYVQLRSTELGIMPLRIPDALHGPVTRTVHKVQADDLRWDWERASKRIRLGFAEVADQALVQPGDTPEVIETFKVLLGEMPFLDALDAARNLK